MTKLERFLRVSGACGLGRRWVDRCRSKRLEYVWDASVRATRRDPNSLHTAWRRWFVFSLFYGQSGVVFDTLRDVYDDDMDCTSVALRTAVLAAFRAVTV